MSCRQSTRTTIPLSHEATGAKRIDVVGMFDNWHGSGITPGVGEMTRMGRLEVFIEEAENPQIVIDLPYGDMAALRNAISAMFVANEHKTSR